MSLTGATGKSQSIEPRFRVYANLVTATLNPRAEGRSTVSSSFTSKLRPQRGQTTCCAPDERLAVFCTGKESPCGHWMKVISPAAMRVLLLLNAAAFARTFPLTGPTSEQNHNSSQQFRRTSYAGDVTLETRFLPQDRCNPLSNLIFVDAPVMKVRASLGISSP